MSFPGEEPVGKLDEIVDSLLAERRFVNKITIGPKAIPGNTTNTELADTLSSYRTQSCDLGWIENPGICQSLQANLDNVKHQLELGNTHAAANNLRAFLNELEAVREQHLSSEAYALLKFNGEYLFEKLQNGSGINCDCPNPVDPSSGTIAINDGETRCLAGDFSGSVFFETGGTLNVCGTATFQNISGNQPGVINIAETGHVTIGSWTNNYSEDAINNRGTLEIVNGLTVNNGTLANHGTTTVSGGLNQNNGSVANYGQMDVSGPVTFNRAGNLNEGSWAIGAGLTLNSDASLTNRCRLDVAGPFMINGAYSAEDGALTTANQQLTVNSGGIVSLSGEDVMVSAASVMLNGSIASGGTNHLLAVENQFQANAGAAVTSSGSLLGVCSPDAAGLSPAFEITDGCSFVLPKTSCNPAGFNSNP